MCWARRFTFRAGGSRTPDGRLQSRDFLRSKATEFAGANVEFQWAIADAPDLLHVMANSFKHTANLAVSAFGKSDFIPGIGGFANDADSGGRRPNAPAFVGFDGHAFAEFVDPFGGWIARDFDNIGFGNVAGGFHQRMREITIVGEQEQPLAGIVEAAHR